jgi:hypothetical protein
MWQGTIDFTGSQMVLTLKCVAFAVNIYDGTRVKVSPSFHCLPPFTPVGAW